MQTLLNVFIMTAPLLFALLAALCSEYAGVLAVFIEGIISLSGFLFVYFSLHFNNIVLGFIAGLLSVLGFVFIIALFTQKTRANPFLTGLSINLFSTAFISYLLSGSAVLPLSQKLRASLAAQWLSPLFFASLAVVFAFAVFLALRYTRIGINFKYVGSAAEELFAHGVSVAQYRIAAWLLAAFFSFFAGVTLALRLSAFTVNLSAGRGWLALAAVFLANKHALAGILIAFALSLAEYASYSLQDMSNISGSLLLALPYALALALALVGAVFTNRSFRRKKQ